MKRSLSAILLLSAFLSAAFSQGNTLAVRRKWNFSISTGLVYGGPCMPLVLLIVRTH